MVLLAMFRQRTINYYSRMILMYTTNFRGKITQFCQILRGDKSHCCWKQRSDLLLSCLGDFHFLDIILNTVHHRHHHLFGKCPFLPCSAMVRCFHVCPRVDTQPLVTFPRVITWLQSPSGSYLSMGIWSEFLEAGFPSWCQPTLD